MPHDNATKADYEQVVDILSKETGLSISIDYNYKFLVLLPFEADENIRGTQALLWNYATRRVGC